MSRILVVGQTPPPFHGQSIMIESMLDGDYGDIELYHVRMAFSQEMDQVGVWNIRKIGELVRIIGSILHARFVHGVRILYYPPAGPNIVPVLRDLAILIATRWAFAKTIFHFHAGGVSDLYGDLGYFLRFLFRMAYFRPDLAIRVSEYAPEDGKKIKAREECVVPNGVEDLGGRYVQGGRLIPAGQPAGKGAGGGAHGRRSQDGRPAHLLFVGALRESKGVMVLLEACGTLLERGIPFQANLVGGFESGEFGERVRDYVERQGLGECVTFLGALTGEEKLEAYGAADLFCFPTYYGAETFGVVLVEAMSFGLPVVATKWRGIPGIVEDGVSGFLVPIKDSAAVAVELEKLILDPALGRSMGAQGRGRYLERFTVDEYHRRLREAFALVSSDSF